MSGAMPKNARERFAKLYFWSAAAAISGPNAGEKQVQKLKDVLAEWFLHVALSSNGDEPDEESLLRSAATAFTELGPSPETARALSSALQVARVEIEKRGEDPRRWYERGQYA